MSGSDDEFDPAQYVAKYLSYWEHDQKARFVVFLRTWYNVSHSEVRTDRRMLGPFTYQEAVTLVKQLPKNLHGAYLYRDVHAYHLDDKWPEGITRPGIVVEEQVLTPLIDAPKVPRAKRKVVE